jgi:hypothetical protein
MEDATSNPTTVTEAQALQIIKQGVTRDVKFDVSCTMAYCTDATKLRGFNVRKLAQKLEVRAEEAGEPTFNSDSYQSNISTANGIMGLFDYDLDAFRVWFEENPTKSLKAIFNAFRELFGPVKPPKPAKGEEGENGENNSEPTPVIDVVLSLIPQLSADERMLVVMLIAELDSASDNADVVENEQEDVADAA